MTYAPQVAHRILWGVDLKPKYDRCNRFLWLVASIYYDVSRALPLAASTSLLYPSSLAIAIILGILSRGTDSLRCPLLRGSGCGRHYRFLSPRNESSISKQTPLLVGRHGRRSTIKQTLFHFRQSGEIVGNIVIPASWQSPIKGLSESGSRIRFQEGTTKFIGLLGDLFEFLGVRLSAGTTTRGNGLGNLFRTTFNQIYQQVSGQEESFVSFSE